MDKALEIFAHRMQYKLDKNKYKDCKIMNKDGKGRGWVGLSKFWLLKRLKGEIEELNTAMEGQLAFPIDSVDAILDECADVANFAMMIFDNYSNPKNPKNK